ncbi:MAG: amino acid ABC transporter permease [Oscillospiraceae bacterium]|nr:amino acid ABC transporter permease [Oscillospiraceae bacterium]
MPQSFFDWVILLLKEYYPLFIRGTLITLTVAITGTIIGFIIGLGVAIVRTIPLHENDTKIKKILFKIIKFILVAYIEIFRGTPMIVQAMVIYYGALQYLKLDMPILFAAIFIISINTGAYMAEIIRGGIVSIDVGQTEGSQSIGMTHWQTMVHIIIPQAVRNIMPAVGNEFVINIKDSSVLNVISVAELFFMTKSAAGTYLRYFEVFFITAIIYFVLTFTVTRILKFLEKKMDGPSSYTMVRKEV